MNSEEQAFLQQQEQQMRNMQSGVEAQQLNQQQQQMMLENSEGNIIKEQLDLKQDIIDLKHQLKGEVKTYKENGEEVWTEPENKDLVILSEAGVNYCMWMIQGYLTKNTLLSNYKEETINEKMEDFSVTIADTLFMKYDTYFRQPTPEECRDEVERRIKKKIDLKKFSKELLGQESDDEGIKKQVRLEMEASIDREFEIIKQQKMKDKLKMFDSVQRLIQDSVHSAYLRALNGQERRTLRQHIHISEQRGASQPQKKSGGIFNWIKPD